MGKAGARLFSHRRLRASEEGCARNLETPWAERKHKDAAFLAYPPDCGNRTGAFQCV